MSSNNIILIFLTIFTITTMNAKNVTKSDMDELIMRSILYDKYQNYEYSYKTYKNLFDITKEEFFLFKEVESSLLIQKYTKETLKRVELWDKKHPNRVKVKRFLISLYAIVGDIQNIQKEANHLVKISQDSKDLNLVAQMLYYSGDLENALELLYKAFKIAPTEEILLKIVDILYSTNKEYIKAIELLETYSQVNIATEELYIKLISLYQKNRDTKGMLSSYLKLYEKDQKDIYFNNIINIFIYRKDIAGAISFFEKYRVINNKLFYMYKNNQFYKKATEIAQKLYEIDKNPTWIAEQGMLFFELSIDKNDIQMIMKSIESFEKSIRLGVNDSIYLNYYGYILIDKGIDIERGIEMVKQALLQKPKDHYYLDSLAWGYYKNNQCKKAYPIMKEIVDKEGLKENEIIKHWKAIKKCK